MQPLILVFILNGLQISLALRYHYGDGSLYVGSVDTQGRPTGLGHFHNSSGNLGKAQ